MEYTLSEQEHQIAQNIAEAGLAVAVWIDEDEPMVVVNPHCEETYINIFPDSSTHLTLESEAISYAVPAREVVRELLAHLSIREGDWVVVEETGRGPAWREGHVVGICVDGGLNLAYGERRADPDWCRGDGEWHLPVPQELVSQVWRKSDHGFHSVKWARIR
jgi:hypothetical protein